MTTPPDIDVVDRRGRDTTEGDIVRLPEHVFVPHDQAQPTWPWVRLRTADLLAGNTWRTVVSTCKHGDHPQRGVPAGFTVLQVSNDPPELGSEGEHLIVAVRDLDLCQVQRPCEPAGVYTVCGIWDGDQPILVSVFAGDHPEISEEDHEAFPEGTWALPVTADNAAHARQVAVDIMLAVADPSEEACPRSDAVQIDPLEVEALMRIAAGGVRPRRFGEHEFTVEFAGVRYWVAVDSGKGDTTAVLTAVAVAAIPASRRPVNAPCGGLCTFRWQSPASTTQP